MKKERKLDRIYKEFETTYKDMPEEDMQKVIEAKEKEIKGKEESLEKLEGESKEKLSKDIEQAKKRLENLKGYNKNKTQIAAIIKYREQLSTKLAQTIVKKDESEKMFMSARETYLAATKELSDEKHTMEMDQDEYNTLLQKQADAKKEMLEQGDIYLKSKSRILELQTKIGKCNLAWKTLFVNKTWDDIQRISMQEQGIESKKFTRKVEPDEKIISKKDEEKAVEEPKMTVGEKRLQKRIGETVKQLLKEEKASKKEEPNESKALVEVKSKNPFKKLWDKIVKWVRGEETVSAKQEPRGVTGQAKEAELSSNEEKANSNNEQRDQFLEGLRMHVDKEYKETVKAEKETKYKEAHAAKPKEEETR